MSLSPLLVTLLGVFAVWFGACIWCGYQSRLLRLAVVLAVGLGLNAAWMVWGLDARVFEPHALIAQASLVLYAVGGFGLGWIAGRLVRRWRESRVEDPRA